MFDLSGKYRVVMRRDKIFKIACNHAITGDMQLTAMLSSETSWCWNALDFAENEARVEKFALKFRVSWGHSQGHERAGG